MKLSARERLLDKALELFNRYGFNAVGIDTILKESGVAKNTLYRHFGSKDELIVSVLRKHDQTFRTKLAKAVEQDSITLIANVLRIFDAYELWIERQDFYGCLFINASAEFPDADSSIHMVCAEHKQSVTKYIQAVVESEGFNDSEALARRLLILLDGAVTYAYVTGDKVVIQEAKATAEDTLRTWNRRQKI